MPSELEKLVALGVDHQLKRVTGGGLSETASKVQEYIQAFGSKALSKAQEWSKGASSAAKKNWEAYKPHIIKAVVDMKNTTGEMWSKHGTPTNVAAASAAAVALALVFTSILTSRGSKTKYKNVMHLVELEKEHAETKDAKRRAELKAQIEAASKSAASEVKHFMANNRKPMITASMKQRIEEITSSPKPAAKKAAAPAKKPAAKRTPK